MSRIPSEKLESFVKLMQDHRDGMKQEICKKMDSTVGGIMDSLLKVTADFLVNKLVIGLVEESGNKPTANDIDRDDQLDRSRLVSSPLISSPLSTPTSGVVQNKSATTHTMDPVMTCDASQVANSQNEAGSTAAARLSTSRSKTK